MMINLIAPHNAHTNRENFISPTTRIFLKYALGFSENLPMYFKICSFQVMRTHGFNPSEEDLRDMIRNVDKNSNGAIDFNEFIEMMLKQGVNSDEDAAHGICRLYKFV